MTIPTIQQQTEFARSMDTMYPSAVSSAATKTLKAVQRVIETMDDMPSHLEALQALKEAAPLACAPLSKENDGQD